MSKNFNAPSPPSLERFSRFAFLFLVLLTALASCSPRRVYNPETTSPWDPQARVAKENGLFDRERWEADPDRAFPAWSRCQTSDQCTAIEGRCQEWDYVNRNYAVERAELNIKKRRANHCIDNQDYMKDIPKAACVHGICAPAQLEKIGFERCEEFRNYYDYVRMLGNRCERHEDCKRGLAHCSLGCENFVYPRDAEPILANWQDQYVTSCKSCEKTCIDTMYYTNTGHQPRCIQGACVYRPLRKTFQSDR